MATILSNWSGGTSLADVEEIGTDKALLKLLGITPPPDHRLTRRGG